MTIRPVERLKTEVYDVIYTDGGRLLRTEPNPTSVCEPGAFYCAMKAQDVESPIIPTVGDFGPFIIPHKKV
jgi:hypothetical protein